MPDGLDPAPARVGSHRPDVACVNCHKAKCMCDKQKPVCGACQKRGIQCIPRENQRTVKAQARANRSAAAQKSAPPAQLPPAALPPQVEHNHQQPVMKTSLEDMFDGEAIAYQQERSSSEATASPNSFMSGPVLTGNMATRGPFPLTMNAFTFPTANYDEEFENFDHPLHPFSPKDADLGPRSQTFTNMIDLSRHPSFGTDFEGYGIADLTAFSVSDGILSEYGEFTDFGGFVTNDNTNHAFAGNQNGFKHIGQNDGHVSAQHTSQMSHQLLPNATHQQVYPQFEPSGDSINSLPPTPHQDFALMSYGLPSPAKTTPSPPPTGSYGQFGGCEATVTHSESQDILRERWKDQFGNVPFEVLESFVSTNKELLKKRGSF